MNVEEEFLDVLQNIETAIVGVYKSQPALLDVEVLDALDGLIRVYTWENERRGTPTIRLSDRPQRVYEGCRRICEWRLGRQPLNSNEALRNEDSDEELTTAEVLLCLQRIRSSVRLWNRQGGRQGYLDYVRQFLGDAMQGSGT